MVAEAKTKGKKKRQVERAREETTHVTLQQHLSTLFCSALLCPVLFPSTMRFLWYCSKPHIILHTRRCTCVGFTRDPQPHFTEAHYSRLSSSSQLLLLSDQRHIKKSIEIYEQHGFETEKNPTLLSSA